MPSLEYYSRDPSTGTIRKYAAEEVQQLLADSSKPAFFSCLGMDGFSGKTDPERQIRCVEGFFDGHTPKEFHVIAVINGEKRFTDIQLSNYLHRFSQRITKPQKNITPEEAYRSEYDQPASFGMQLLKDTFEQNIPYVGYMNQEEHDRLVGQTKLKFSQYNFFGHSFGTVVLAETFEYLGGMLRQKGFEPEEIEDCLRCMGRLSVGNSYHITEQHAVVPGLDYNSALDRIAQKHNNIPKNRDSDVLLMERIGDGLIIAPLIGENSVPTVRIKATDEADAEERRSFSTKLKRGAGKEKTSPWEVIAEDISDPGFHALQLYMYKDGRLQPDSDNARARLTGQAYPGAEVANDFVMRLFDTSKEATESGRVRDTRAIVDKIQEDLALPATRNALAAGYQASQERFHRHFGEAPSR